MTTEYTSRENASRFLRRGFLCYVLALLSFVYTFIATGFLIVCYFALVSTGIYFNAKGFSHALQIEEGEESGRSGKMLLQFGNLFFLFFGVVSLTGSIVLIMELQNTRWPFG
ncbi:MAG: hypothetical protein AAFV95_12225 [Bacteroidota bacterium]